MARQQLIEELYHEADYWHVNTGGETIHAKRMPGFYRNLKWLSMVVFCDAEDCLLLISQGDEWDTQKDMAYSVVGALIPLLIHSRLTRRRKIS